MLTVISRRRGVFRLALEFLRKKIYSKGLSEEPAIDPILMSLLSLSCFNPGQT